MTNSNEVQVAFDNDDVFLSKGDLSIFDDVDKVTAQSIEEGDPQIATRLGRALHRGLRVQGVALCKLLSVMRDNWSKFEADGIEDNYYSVMESEIGLAVSTVHKYCDMWSSVFANPDIPDEIKQCLLNKPVKTLLLLPALAKDAEGVEWEDVAKTTSHQEMRELIRWYRGEATSSETAIHIRLDVVSGQLSARKGTGEYVVFGILNMDKRRDPAVDGAIDRICREARISEM
jgi:hypothetical protein